MTQSRVRCVVTAGLTFLVAIAFVAQPVLADASILEAAAKAKKTGLPLFVMFGGPGCVHCQNMKKRLESEGDLPKIMSTQFVFVETSPSGSEAKQFIEHYKLKVSGIPHSVIVSAKGELVKEQVGHPPGDALNKLLMEGIEKTGGVKSIASAAPKKDGKLSKEDLEAVLKQVADAKEKLASEDTMLEAMVDLLGISRAHRKSTEVKKEVAPLFAEINKDKAKTAVLAQARQLDSAAAAIEGKKEKLAIATYKSVIQKYPDSAAARFAQSKLDSIDGGTKTTDASETESGKVAAKDASN